MNPEEQNPTAVNTQPIAQPTVISPNIPNAQTDPSVLPQSTIGLAQPQQVAPQTAMPQPMPPQSDPSVPQQPIVGGTPIPPVQPPKKRSFMPFIMLMVAVFAVLISIGLIFVFIRGSANDLSKTHVESFELKNTKLSINVPDRLNIQEDTGGVKTFRYTPANEKNKKDKASAQIVVAVTPISTLTKDQISLVEAIFKDTSNAQYKPTNEATKKTINGALSQNLCKNDVKIDEPKKVEFKGALFGIAYPFSCKADSEGKLVASGKYLIGFVEGKSVEVLLVGVNEVWTKNTKTWDAVSQSLTVQ